MIGRKLPDQRGFDRSLKQRLGRWLAGFSCAAILLMGGCSRQVDPQPLITIEQQISPEPVRVGPATITFKLADAAGKPVTGATIAVEADMSHAGMSPRFADAKEVDSGRYQVHLEFPMAGDWVILLHVTLPDGKKLERQIDVRGVRPN